MNIKLLEQSVEIFGSLEKWEALFELYEQTGQIMNYWLATGAKALIEEFKNNPSLGWECRKWDQDYEVRWHLEKFGRDSIGIGFGWPTWEFHLHILRRSKDEQNCAAEILKKPEFQPLLAVFGSQDNVPRRTGEGSLACDVTFNPYSGVAAANERRRALAWQAAHQTEDFVRMMAAKIREVTDNPVLMELVQRINCQAMKKVVG